MAISIARDRFARRISPLTNITPFTYRDGLTFQGLLHEIKDYLLNVVEPHFEEEIARVISEFNETISEFAEDIIESEIQHGNTIRDFIDEIETRFLKHVQDIEDRVEWINRREASALAYRKRVVHSLPFKFPDYDAAYSRWGSLYPQSFKVDSETNELFVNYMGTGFNAVAVFDWTSGEYKSCFGWKSGYASEGLEIVYEGGKRYMYIRYLTNGLGKFDITVLPQNLAERTPEKTYDTNQGVNFSYRNGVWTVTDQTNPMGFNISRGNFKKLDSNFNPIGAFSVPEMLAGGNPYKYRSSTMPKMQGFADVGGNYAFGIGGFHGKGAEVTPYGYQGFRLFSGQGMLLADNLMRPDLMIEVLERAGYRPSRVENEGVQLVGNKIITFFVTGSYGPSEVNREEGLLFLEEYADHPDSIDFTDAGVTWTALDIDRVQYGRWPRQIDNKMYNPIENTVLDSLPLIIDFMTAMNQSEFSFYSSSAAVTDMDGVQIPAGQLVNISNANNDTFIVTMTDSIRTKTSRIYPTPGVPGAFTTLRDDTGWIPLTLTAPAVAFGGVGSSPAMRRIDGITYLRGVVKGLPTGPSKVTIGTFHGQYAPEVDIPAIQTGEGNSTARWLINKDGYVTLEGTNLATTSVNTWYPLPAISWISKNTNI